MRFGSFELLEKLGRGSTAVVFKARRQSSGEIVALKIGVPFLSIDRAGFERFQREFTHIKHIVHPNLVPVLEFGMERGCPFLVQEYLDGHNLEQRIRNGGPLSLAEGVNAMLQVARGLQALHQHQMLHRDVKPGNIYLNSRGEFKLGDFGLLKTLSPPSELTKIYQAMGTAEFSAPEQFEDARGADYRSDVYSVATTFYTAVTGLFPFGSGSVRRILLRKLRDQFIPLNCLLPAAPKELVELISESMQSDRQRRPASVDAFIESLSRVRNRLLRSGPIADAPPEPPLADGKTGPERRTAARIAVKVPAAFVQFHQNKRVPFAATVVDVSSGGMCLQGNTLIPCTTILEITASDTGDSHLVQIRWAKTLAPDSFLYGCSFVHRPKAQELAKLSPAIATMADFEIDASGHSGRA